jgi:hypothetical protein
MFKVNNKMYLLFSFIIVIINNFFFFKFFKLFLLILPLIVIRFIAINIIFIYIYLELNEIKSREVKNFKRLDIISNSRICINVVYEVQYLY